MFADEPETLLISTWFLAATLASIEKALRFEDD